MGIFGKALGAMSDRAKLLNSDLFKQVVPKNVVLVSITSCAPVVGSIDIPIIRNIATLKGVEGLGKTMEGYLYHDGKNISFATTDSTYFSAPISEVKAEKTNLGFLLLFNNGSKVLMGQSMPVRDKLFAKPFRGVKTEKEQTWLNEFQRLGVLNST